MPDSAICSKTGYFYELLAAVGHGTELVFGHMKGLQIAVNPIPLGGSVAGCSVSALSVLVLWWFGQ